MSGLLTRAKVLDVWTSKDLQGRDLKHFMRK